MGRLPLLVSMVELPEPGRRIKARVSTHNETVEHVGLVLPPAAPRHVSIKLDNGYNVSYPVEAVEEWEELDPLQPPPSGELHRPEENDALPRVRLIHTGGTIASKVDYATGAVEAKFEPEEMLDAIPELAQIARLDAVKIGNMFSDDIRPKHWNIMANACADAFADGCRGVVIAHGTDTLHITSSALNFAFAGKGTRPAGPIVMVGSQRSSDRGSSDATENLLAAVHWAATGPLPIGDAGDAVSLVMHDAQSDGVMAVHSGLAVRKMHSTRRDAFQPVNGQPIAKITISPDGFTTAWLPWYEKAREEATQRPVTERPTTYEPGQRFAQFIAGPWLYAEQIEAVVNTGVQGVIIHGTGLGHLPIDDPQNDAPENALLWRALTRCVNRELPVLIVNQCIHGPVDMNVYSKGRKQQAMGLLGHGITSTPEAMTAKLHWVLSQNLDIKKALASNLCGEHRETLWE
ncbi:MAG: Glu-tRNA(Gln) amidotransferase GatDE subunit D [Candidatus Poseidoniales archaeon]|nr:MAG: Glu-tRNA(Gln) amidotransferase GatDE subunit D [Candidatus Poseidoniales archaeon]